MEAIVRTLAGGPLGRLLERISHAGQIIPVPNLSLVRAAAPSRQDVLYVMLVSGLIGLYLGIECGWQVNIESAQVVAGIVEYPRDNPFAMYHLKTWTLLHQVPALLLACGVPERPLAMVVSGLAGMLCFQALALCAYAAGASRWLASLVPVLLRGSEVYAEVGSVYPVRILSNAPWVLYGCVGTALVLMIWSLLGVGFRRSGALLMGIAPAIHPTMGAWCLAIGLPALVWTWRHERSQLKTMARWLAAGMAITVASLAIHLYLSRDVPDIPHYEKAQYIAAFAANWDSHRKPFPMDHMVIVMAGLTVAMCGVMLRFLSDRLNDSARFLFCALTISATLSVLLCLSTQWQDSLPTALLMAMPGRYVNVVGLAFPALCLGLLYRYRATFAAHFALGLLMLYVMMTVQRFELARVYVPLPGTMFLAAALAFLAQAGYLASLAGGAGTPIVLRILRLAAPLAVAGLAMSTGLLTPRFAFIYWLVCGAAVIGCRPLAARFAGLLGWLELGLMAAAWASAAMVLKPPFAVSLMAGLAAWHLGHHADLAEQFLQWFRLLQARRALICGLTIFSVLGGAYVFRLKAAEAYLEMYDWRDHPVYAAAHRGEGFLLTASVIRATQLRTRRPVLLEGPALNQLPYVPESGPSMNRILKKIYGEDLFAPRPDDWVRGGGLMPHSGRKLWENRSVEEWQQLAREFGFTQIVTFSTWELKLPVVAYAKGMLLYEVPGVAPRRTDPAVQVSRATQAAEPKIRK